MCCRYFDRMSKTSCFVILAVAVATFPQLEYTQNLTFITTPGLVRIEEHRKAKFTWDTDNYPNRTGQRIYYMYGEDKMCSFNANGHLIGYKQYRDHVICSKTTSFELQNATEEFTKHNFSVMITLGNTSYNNSDASLFIYRKPNVQIDYPMNITEGDTINITCNASSTSLPVAHRLPISFTWRINDQPITNLTEYSIVLSDPDDGSLTIRDIKATDTDITCVATEYGSTLKSIGSVHVHVEECIGCDGNDNNNDNNGGKTTKSGNKTVSKAKLAWILGGIALFVFVVLVSVIGYLLWERTHKSKGCSIMARCPCRKKTGKQDNVSDSDSDHLYDVIRNSNIPPVTISTINAVHASPALPKRHPNMCAIEQDDAGHHTYDYALEPCIDVRNIATSCTNKTNPGQVSAIYSDDAIQRQIRTNVDGYMDTEGMEMSPRVNTSDVPNGNVIVSPGRKESSVVEYAVVDKSKKAFAPDTEHDIVECPVYIPMTEKQTDTRHSDTIEQDGVSLHESSSGSTNGDHNENQPMKDIDTGGEYMRAGAIVLCESLPDASNSGHELNLYNLAGNDTQPTT